VTATARGDAATVGVGRATSLNPEIERFSRSGIQFHAIPADISFSFAFHHLHQAFRVHSGTVEGRTP
jgi:hypothetical protein